MGVSSPSSGRVVGPAAPATCVLVTGSPVAYRSLGSRERQVQLPRAAFCRIPVGSVRYERTGASVHHTPWDTVLWLENEIPKL